MKSHPHASGLPRHVGPDYVKWLRLTYESPDRLSLRSAPSPVDYARAMLVLAVLTGVGCIFAVRYVPNADSPWVALSGVLVPVAAGMLDYTLIMWLFPRRIELDRGRGLLLVNGRTRAPLTEIASVELRPWAVTWCKMALLLEDGHRVEITKYASPHTRVRPLIDALTSFLGVPLLDLSEGDYAAILQLRIDDERMNLRPPNQRLANGAARATFLLLAAGYLIFVMPRLTHQINGRGLGYLFAGLGYGVYRLCVWLFHVRITADRRTNTLRAGWFVTVPLAQVDHVAMNVRKDMTYHEFQAELVLRDGRRLFVIRYWWYPPTLVRAAQQIAAFLRVPLRDYEAEGVNAARAEKKRGAGRQ